MKPHRINKWDWIAVSGILLLLAASSFWIWKHQASQDAVTAIVTLDGVEIIRIPLTGHHGVQRISLWEEYEVPVSLEIEEERIRFVDVTCPDHICEKTGYLSKPYQTAVCLPNRTAVSLFADSQLP